MLSMTAGLACLSPRWETERSLSCHRSSLALASRVRSVRRRPRASAVDPSVGRELLHRAASVEPSADAESHTEMSKWFGGAEESGSDDDDESSSSSEDSEEGSEEVRARARVWVWARVRVKD